MTGYPSIQPFTSVLSPEEQALVEIESLFSFKVTLNTSVPKGVISFYRVNASVRPLAHD